MLEAEINNSKKDFACTLKFYTSIFFHTFVITVYKSLTKNSVDSFREWYLSIENGEGESSLFFIYVIFLSFFPTRQISHLSPSRSFPASNLPDGLSPRPR